MANEKKINEPVREFRLEGVGLLLVGGLLIVLLGGAFYVGRWYERQVNPPQAATLGLDAADDPLANVAAAEPAADVDEGAGYFDDLEGEQKELEPERQAREAARAEPPPPAPASTTAPAPAAAPATGGRFYVQVVAGRDRSAIENVVNELSRKGYSVRLFSEPEGGGTLYKVRVGGYGTRDGARDVAQKLKTEGYAGAWVTEVE
jgi:cell division septation protein DedD